MAAIPKIELKDVTYYYNPGTAFTKKALDSVCLKVMEGEFLGLIGPTGSGKSTLIQHFNALVKPASGTVCLDGKDINADRARLRDVRRNVGLVFQYPEHQLFETTVFKDVSFGPAGLGLSGGEVEERARRALRLTGVPEEVYEKSPFELSGGQKRRAAIAGVLAMEPSVLVLDEPTAGLDPRGRGEILENIRLMHEQLGITIILVSHSMEEVSQLSQRVAVMERGRLAMCGGVREVFGQAEELERIGLACPQISSVMTKLKHMGLNAPTDAFTVDEAVEALYSLLMGDAK